MLTWYPLQPAIVILVFGRPFVPYVVVGHVQASMKLFVKSSAEP